MAKEVRAAPRSLLQGLVSQTAAAMEIPVHAMLFDTNQDVTQIDGLLQADSRNLYLDSSNILKYMGQPMRSAVQAHTAASEDSEDIVEAPERSASCLGRLNGVSRRKYTPRSNSVCTHSRPELEDDMVSVMLVDDVEEPVALGDQKPVTVGDVKLNNAYCFDPETINSYD